MEIQLHLELQNIDKELKQLYIDWDIEFDSCQGGCDDITKKINSLIIQGIKVAKQLKTLIIKRDNCELQKHLMLIKYPEKYKTLEDLKHLDLDYNLTAF